MAAEVGQLLNYGSSLLMWVVIIIAVLVFGGIAFGATYFLRKRLQYTYDCVIFEATGKDTPPVVDYDKGGVILDRKTGNKLFFLKKYKVGLNPDNIPYNHDTKGTKRVFLFRDGIKNFKFLKMSIYSNPGLVIDVGEEDVNWATNTYERQKKLFAQTMLMQLMPYIIIAFVSIIILIIFIYFFKDFDTLRETAIALREAAVAIKGGGTTVVQ